MADMADERTARPVSGEIMADAAREAQPNPGARGAADVVDAEFETIPSDAGSGSPAAPQASAAIATPAAPLAGMAMLRGGAAALRSGPTRGGPLFWTIGLALAAAAFWVSGGHALVRGSGLFDAPTPASALHIAGVTSHVDASGPRPLLFVDGEAVNDGAASEILPPFDIVVTGNDGRVTRYRLGTAGRPLAPGERFAFSSRLEVPKNGVKTVSVAFAE